MSATIYYKDKTYKNYNKDESVQNQLENAEYVKITTKDDNGITANDLLSKVNSISNFYILPPVKFKVDHENTVLGAKTRKEAKKTQKHLALVWAIGEIVKIQSELDRKFNSVIDSIRKK